MNRNVCFFASALVLALLGPGSHADQYDRDRRNNNRVKIDARSKGVSERQLEREKRREAFMKEAAQRHAFGEIREEVPREEAAVAGGDTPGPEIDYREIFREHIQDRYGLAEGKPLLLPYRLTGTVAKVLDETTVLVKDPTLLDATSSRASTKSPGKYVAVKTDVAAVYSAGEPFSDLMGRRFAATGTFDVRSASGGSRAIPLFKPMESIGYEDFLKHLKQGFSFKKKSDFEQQAFGKSR